MSEKTPTRFNQHEQAAEAALNENARLATIEARRSSPEVAVLNDQAELEIWGSGDRTYTNPETGDIIASPDKPMAGLLDTFAKTRPGPEAKALAERYETGIHQLMENDDLELCQAKMVMDMRMSDEQEGMPSLTTEFMKSDGLSASEAEDKAKSIYSRKDAKRLELIKDNGIFSPEEYDQLKNGNQADTADTTGEATPGDDETSPEADEAGEEQQDTKNEEQAKQKLAQTRAAIRKIEKGKQALDGEIASTRAHLDDAGEQPDDNGEEADTQEKVRFKRIRKLGRQIGEMLGIRESVEQDDSEDGTTNGGDLHTSADTRQGHGPKQGGESAEQDVYEDSQAEESQSEREEHDDINESSDDAPKEGKRNGKEKVELDRESLEALKRINGEAGQTEGSADDDNLPAGESVRVLSAQENVDINRNKALKKLRKGSKLNLGGYGTAKVTETKRDDEGNRIFKIELPDGRVTSMGERRLGELLVPQPEQAQETNGEQQTADNPPANQGDATPEDSENDSDRTHVKVINNSK
jgi:hypothetical protein